jgi:exodeoxyribonuclease VII small subunit
VARKDQSTSESTRDNVATFDATYRELQQLIAQLDDGGLGLEDAVRLFERGQELVKRCQQIVDAAELRVTRLAAEPPSDPVAPLTEA